ncbi:hypothetical protein ACFSC4_25920 [Deinococcus malanensis]|uniref:hypothetical protein n=1 Tax=Deinococcus malanensis TaxID=1706855 RepID=UPI0036323532
MPVLCQRFFGHDDHAGPLIPGRNNVETIGVDIDVHFQAGARRDGKGVDQLLRRLFCCHKIHAALWQPYLLPASSS